MEPYKSWPAARARHFSSRIMKFLTVFAFACVATFAVLHGAYGSPLPAPGPEPSPVADPAPKPEPAANPEPVANPIPEPGPSPAASPAGSLPAGGDANFVALSANAEPMVPSPDAAPLKMGEAPAA